MEFAKKRYSTRDVSSASIDSESRRAWPGVSIMAVGIGLLLSGYIADSFQTMMMGSAAFLGGSMYFRRRKPTYGLRLHMTDGPVIVVASRRKAFLEEIKAAVDRAIDTAPMVATAPRD